MSERIYYVYILIDPRDIGIKYVGCSTNPAVRVRNHMAINPYSESKKDLWLGELKSLNLKPLYEVLFSTNNIEEAAAAELKYFEKYNNGKLLCKSPKLHPFPKRQHWEKQDAATSRNLLHEVH